MRQPRVLIILFFMEFYSRTDGHNSSTIERISFLLEQFCPDDGICLSNRTSVDTDRHSCCSACECGDQCYLSMSCCFPKISDYMDITIRMKSPPVFHRNCLYPFATYPNHDQRMASNSYFMITSEDGATSQEACGNKTVASWGSVFPVYSKRKDLIFKNALCAKAYGVDDGVLWTPFLVCESSTSNLKFIYDGSTFSPSPGVNYIPDDCSVFFKYSDDDIDSHICFNPEEFINTCKYSEFKLPKHLNQYKDEIMSACTSGLISPYKNDDLYANVFCSICNQGAYDSSVICTTSFERSFAARSKFVGLLNIDFLQLDKKGAKKRKFHKACQRSNVQDVSCREIHCPSGRSRDSDGKCYFSTKRWYKTEYRVLVNLTAAHDIDVEQVFKPGQELEVLKPTWPKYSFVTLIGHLITQNSTMSRNILVLIRMSLNEIDPNIFIANINKMIHRHWGLSIGDVQISLHADFSKIKIGFGYPFYFNEPTERRL